VAAGTVLLQETGALLVDLPRQVRRRRNRVLSKFGFPRIQKVPLTELAPLVAEENWEEYFAEIPEKPAEHPKAAANPAKLAITSTPQSGFIATPLQSPAIVQTTVDEPINVPSFKGIRKS